MLPEMHDWLKFRNLFGWVWGFVENYFRSRRYRGTLLVIPFLIMGIAAPAFLWWLKGAPQTNTVTRYEQTLKNALQSDDHETARVCLESLIRLRPQDKAYRYKLALQLLEHEQEEAGLAHLRPLLDPGPNGYNPARLWLVKQASWNKPVVQVSQQAIEQQLIMILDSDSTNIEANYLMADFYARKGQLLQAETRLLKIVEKVPALCLQLAKIQSRLKRSQEQIDFQLSKALNYYQDRLLIAPDDTDARIQLAETLEMSNRWQDAARTLDEGIQRNESTTLKSALSLLYLRMATRQLAASSVNRNTSAELLLEAARLNPGDPQIANGLLTVIESGIEVSPEDLQPSIEWWSQQPERAEDDAVLLARFLNSAQRHEEGFAALSAVAEQTPQLRAMQAAMLNSAGNKQKSDQMVGELISEFTDRATSLSSVEVLVFANVLMMDEQFEEARSLLQKHLSSDTADSDTGLTSPRNEVQKLNTAFARASVGLFDQRYQDETFNDVNAALNLLNDALQVSSFSGNVLNKLTDIAVDPENRFSKAASQNVASLLARGNTNAKVAIYGMLGTKFLGRNNLADARTNLERAYSLSQTNPIVLNNLALTLVRKRPVTKENAERALRLVEDFLKASPDNANGLSTRGEVFVALERWEDARADFELSFSLQPASLDSRKLLVTVFDALEEPALAAQHQQIVEQQTSSKTPTP